MPNVRVKTIRGAAGDVGILSISFNSTVAITISPFQNEDKLAHDCVISVHSDLAYGTSEM